MKSQMAPTLTYPTRTASRRKPDKPSPTDRRQSHQKETSQEEEEANNLGKYQDFNLSSKDFGETIRT